LDEAAALIGLALAPEHRPGVLLNLQRIAKMAVMVVDFPVPDNSEPAPVFTL
jgi:hypothetical protein